MTFLNIVPYCWLNIQICNYQINALAWYWPAVDPTKSYQNSLIRYFCFTKTQQQTESKLIDGRSIHILCPAVKARTATTWSGYLLCRYIMTITCADVHYQNLFLEGWSDGRQHEIPAGIIISANTQLWQRDLQALYWAFDWNDVGWCVPPNPDALAALH